MIEYFRHLKEEVNEKLEKKKSLIYGFKIAMYIRIIPLIFINDIIVSFLPTIIGFCLHLFEITTLTSLDIIKKLVFLVSTSGNIIYYINKVFKPTKKDIQEVEKEINISEFTIEKIDEEINKQKQILKELSIDKRKDNEESLAYDSEYKWSSDYIRLNYVDQIDNLEENIWELVDVEEDKIKQDQNKRTLNKKLIKNKDIRRI